MTGFYPRKMIKISKIILGCLAVWGAIVILCLGFFLFIRHQFKWTYIEESRISSPDNKYDAVVCGGDAGPMTEYRYSLFIVPKGKPIVPKEIVIDSRFLKPHDVEWTGNKEVLVKHSCDKILYYAPIWSYPKYSKIKDTIKIRLKIEY